MAVGRKAKGNHCLYFIYKKSFIKGKLYLKQCHQKRNKLTISEIHFKDNMEEVYIKVSEAVLI